MILFPRKSKLLLITGCASLIFSFIAPSSSRAATCAGTVSITCSPFENVYTPTGEYVQGCGCYNPSGSSDDGLGCESNTEQTQDNPDNGQCCTVNGESCSNGEDECSTCNTICQLCDNTQPENAPSNYPYQ